MSKGYTYAENDGFSEWLFGGNTKSGETYQFEQTDAIVVVRCLSDPVRNTDRWVDVRHILLTKEKYGTDEEAKKKADEVLAEWKAGAAIEDSFGELAKTYSEDGNAATGGLYTGVYPGQMVATFNDWCFDAARQTGDTGVVQTTYGYHVMYFVGRDGERWYALSQEACLDEAYKATKQQYIDRYVLEMNDGALQEISL